jgi:DUF1009 family protein
MTHPPRPYGLIAGAGRFPILALEEARRLGHQVVAVALKEEASPEVEALAWRCYWISIGELGKLIEILKKETISEVMMAGQVKHARIFSLIRADWRLAKLLASLPRRNTDALIGGVADALAAEGITLADSTTLLKPMLASEGVLTRRNPTEEELLAIDYGRRVAHALAGFDIGQSVAIAERACVAVEAMEGTDAMLRRAAGLANGRGLVLVKVSTRRKRLLFDVPVAGPGTIAVMRECGATALAVDAGRTLLLDRTQLIAMADAYKLSILGCQPLE